MQDEMTDDRWRERSGRGEKRSRQAYQMLIKNSCAVWCSRLKEIIVCLPSLPLLKRYEKWLEFSVPSSAPRAQPSRSAAQACATLELADLCFCTALRLLTFRTRHFDQRLRKSRPVRAAAAPMKQQFRVPLKYILCVSEKNRSSARNA